MKFDFVKSAISIAVYECVCTLLLNLILTFFNDQKKEFFEKLPNKILSVFSWHFIYLEEGLLFW